MASKLPKIPQSEEEKQKNAADNEQHAALVAGGASKSKLRKVVCFNFQKNGCDKGADCEKLHVGEPGCMRAEILARLAKKNGVKEGAAHWDAKRPQSATAVAAKEEARERKKQKKKKAPQEDNLECQLYVSFGLFFNQAPDLNIDNTLNKSF